MIRTACRGLFALVISSLTSGLASTGVAAQTDTVPGVTPAERLAPGSPFAGFETHFLANGVRVWYRYFPEAPDVSVSVTVPFGHDQDPVGREETAHFLEHVLFSDHDGRTEEEIKDEIEGRGGVRNGFTTADRTWYYVALPKEHGTFGIEWLGRIVEPHTLDADVVARNRQPVILELALRPPELPDRMLRLLDPAFMRPAEFWEREFARPGRAARVYSRWQSLHAIEPSDLRSFYEAHYTPQALTVTVIGDLDRDDALAAVESAFGGLQGGLPPTAYPAAVDPGRALSHSFWDLGANVRYWRYYKVYQPSAMDLVDLEGIRLLLSRRLNQRLRYGERKAVYGINVAVVSRGDVAYLAVSAPIEPEEYGFFTEVLNEEVAALRDGGAEDQFAVDRDAVAELLTAQVQTAQDMNMWVYRTFYAPAFTDLPDLVARIRGHSAGSMAEAATRLLREDGRFEQIVQPYPIPIVALGAALTLLVWLTFRLVAGRLQTPARMDQVRFVGRLRWPLAERLARLGIATGAALVGLRLLFWLWTVITFNLLLPIRSWPIQMAAYALMGVTTLGLVLLAMARRPRKVMVFTDHLRIKMLSWASRIIPIETVTAVEPVRFRTGKGVQVVAQGRTFKWRLRDPDGFMRAWVAVHGDWVDVKSDARV